MVKMAAALATGLLGATVGAMSVVRLATRLDRLHVRTDAAWAALDAALNRRAFAVSRLGADLPATSQGAGPQGAAAECAALAAANAAAAAAAALRAGPAAREEAENELGQVIAVLDRAEIDPDHAAQLADAEARVVIARRVYNDAVRDTVALRSHPMVRWLQLAGTAAVPRYFEIAEPSLPGEPPSWPR